MGFRELLQKMQLHSFVSYWYFRLRWIAKSATGVRQRAIRSYLASADVKKLQLGTGGHRIEGWLNSDLYANLGDAQLDVTEPFPIDDGVFDYVYSEHLIEHISYPDGLRMLKESYRVLKPGGVTRVATPSLEALFNLYRTDKSELQLEFIRHQTDEHIDHATLYQDTFVINNMVRNWGHQFIYDDKVLRNALEQAGFVNIERLDLSESNDLELQALENPGRMPEGMLALVTIVLEGKKPASPATPRTSSPL